MKHSFAASRTLITWITMAWFKWACNRFYHPKSKGPTGEGSFITLWQYEHGTWKITRAISYDHHLAAK